jgi:hypothetical protein
MVQVGTDKLTAVSYTVFTGSFILVALGGVFIGVMMAFICSIATRFVHFFVELLGNIF